jgi:hypothetical protein
LAPSEAAILSLSDKKRFVKKSLSFQNSVFVTRKKLHNHHKEKN